MIHHIRGANFCLWCSISLLEMRHCTIPGHVCLAAYDMIPEVGEDYAVNLTRVRRMSGASAGDERTRKSVRRVFMHVNTRCISAETRVDITCRNFQVKMPCQYPGQIYLAISLGVNVRSVRDGDV